MAKNTQGYHSACNVVMILSASTLRRWAGGIGIEGLKKGRELVNKAISGSAILTQPPPVGLSILCSIVMGAEKDRCLFLSASLFATN